MRENAADTLPRNSDANSMKNKAAINCMALEFRASREYEAITTKVSRAINSTVAIGKPV